MAQHARPKVSGQSEFARIVVDEVVQLGQEEALLAYLLAQLAVNGDRHSHWKAPRFQM